MLNTLETFLTLSYFLDPIYLQSTLMDAGIYPWNLLLTAFVTFPSYRIPPLNYTYNIHTTRKFRFFKNLGGSDAVTKDNIQICFTYLSSFGNQKSSYLCFFKKSCYDLWVFNICFHEKKRQIQSYPICVILYQKNLNSHIEDDTTYFFKSYY